MSSSLIWMRGGSGLPHSTAAADQALVDAWRDRLLRITWRACRAKNNAMLLVVLAVQCRCRREKQTGTATSPGPAPGDARARATDRRVSAGTRRAAFHSLLFPNCTARTTHRQTALHISQATNSPALSAHPHVLLSSRRVLVAASKTSPTNPPSPLPSGRASAPRRPK